MLTSQILPVLYDDLCRSLSARAEPSATSARSSSSASGTSHDLANGYMICWPYECRSTSARTLFAGDCRYAAKAFVSSASNGAEPGYDSEHGFCCDGSSVGKP